MRTNPTPTSQPTPRPSSLRPSASARRGVVLAAALGLALIVAACGGGSESDRGSAAEAQPEAPATSESGPSGGTETGSGSSSDAASGSGSTSDSCAEVYARFAAAASSAMGGSPEGLEDLDLRAAMDELRTVVPEELEDDMALLADAYGAFADALAEVDHDVTRLTSDPDRVAVLEAMGTPELAAAGERISSYFDETCPVG